MFQKYKLLTVILCGILLSSNISYAVQSHNPKNGQEQKTVMEKNNERGLTQKSGWKFKNINALYYYGKDGKVKTGWFNYKSGKYYLNTISDGEEGLMKLGWYTDKNGNKYFFNTLYGKNFGKAVTGWNWIAGHKYYFDKDGKLYKNKKTPDGQKVDKEGRWTKNSKLQYIKGRGLPLEPIFRLKPKKVNIQNGNPLKGNSVAGKSQKGQHTVTFDYNDTKMGLGTETVVVKDGDYVIPPIPGSDWGYHFLGWYSDKDAEDLYTPFDFNKTPIKKDITLYAVWIDTRTDTDGDGLSDGMERIHKTDKYKKDTDGDGLTDIQELELTTTNPTKKYTFSNNISDADFDMDNDGLTHLQEVQFGSNPIFEDYDDDRLDDKAEKENKTDPNNPDTDNDGLSDGIEVKYGFNPLVSDTNGNGILDKDEIIEVEVSYQGAEGTLKPKAKIRLKAGSAENINIERDNPEESIWMPSEVPGLIDASYDFTASGDIEEATLIFSFPEHYKKTDDFRPAIYYIDTENQEMIRLENQIIDWDNHTVTAKTTHFSKYSMLDEREQEKIWQRDISNSKNQKPNARLEVAFVIDESGSMYDNDPKKIRVDVTKKFIDTLRKNDKVAVIGFDSYARRLQGLTSDFKKAKNSLSGISNYGGGTSLSAGLERALEEFPVAGEDSHKKEDAMKIIVLLTDGQGEYSKKYEQTAIERGIKIYTVGLGQYYDRGLLSSIAQNTSGKSYDAKDSSKLIEEFEKLTRDTIDIVNDTDNDDISDYHEERIRLFNGVVIKLNKSDPDTDNDMLKDGQEIVQITDRKGRVFFKLKSYPNRVDSDRDGQDDSEDPRPLINDSYKIDYLGSPKHLKSVQNRVDKKISDNSSIIDKNELARSIGKWGTKFIVEDYYTFLKERKVNYYGKNREDYWNDEWDKYWNEYCSRMNGYIEYYGFVSEQVHYFRNNLNRAPKNIVELKREKSNWELLSWDESVYHMRPSGFSRSGTYNLKFISKDGKYEGVYVNPYYTSNSNRGKACTEKTDPENMGTYNFDGRYNGGLDKKIIYGANHYVFDIRPYEKYGNVSDRDLPNENESIEANKSRYKGDSGAQNAREKFEQEFEENK